MKTIIKKISEFNEQWEKQSLAFLWFAIGVMVGALALSFSTNLFLTLLG